MSLQDGTYTIQQKASELYLDCAEDSETLHLSDKHGNINPYQRWTVETSNDGGRIIRHFASGRVWDASAPQDSPVKVDSDTGDNPYQRWNIEAEDGYYAIVHVQRGNYVDCKPHTGEQPYVTQHNSGNPYQQWIFNRV